MPVRKSICLHAGSARQALLNSRKTVTQAALQFRDKAMQESGRAPAISQAGLPPMGVLLPQSSSYYTAWQARGRSPSFNTPIHHSHQASLTLQTAGCAAEMTSLLCLQDPCP